jgi:hypothetical protein
MALRRLRVLSASQHGSERAIFVRTTWAFASRPLQSFGDAVVGRRRSITERSWRLCAAAPRELEGSAGASPGENPLRLARRARCSRNDCVTGSISGTLRTSNPGSVALRCGPIRQNGAQRRWTSRTQVETPRCPGRLPGGCAAHGSSTDARCSTTGAARSVRRDASACRRLIGK